MTLNTKILALDFEVAPCEISNFDLENILDTSDEWICSRTGIKKRRVLEGDLSSTDLGISAAKKVIKRCNFDVEKIDLIIAASSAPEDIYPSVSCLIQNAIGAFNSAAFDLRAACSGFLYSLSTAKAFIKSGVYKNILIVATDATTKLTDWQDRSTCVLFGDGAGAAIVSAVESEKDDIEAVDLIARGDCANYITLKLQTKNCPLAKPFQTQYKPYINMKGKDVYKFVMTKIPNAIEKLLEKSNIDKSEIDYFVPHQSNLRMIEALSERLQFENAKTISNIQNYGNMSAASIIVAIREGIDKGEIKLPAKFVLSAFGAGMTAANAVINLDKNI